MRREKYYTYYVLIFILQRINKRLGKWKTGTHVFYIVATMIVEELKA